MRNEKENIQNTSHCKWNVLKYLENMSKLTSKSHFRWSLLKSSERFKSGLNKFKKFQNWSNLNSTMSLGLGIWPNAQTKIQSQVQFGVQTKFKLNQD